MQQAQFFLFGVILIWLVGTGKLAALFSALLAPPTAKATGQKSPSGLDIYG